MKTEVAVVGAGPAGLTAALALAALGSDVLIVAPAFDPARASVDTRTTALMLASIELLKNLGVWERCTGASAPLEGIRIIDARGGLLRAPEVLFRAAELGLAALGANIANPRLTAALHAAAGSAGRLGWRASAVTRVEPGERSVRLQLADGGALEAALAVAADGRNSITRTAAGIATRAWSYPQAALATSFRHARPHGGVTNELHRRAGPLTTVPLTGGASSLVWVDAPQEVARLTELDDASFLALLQEHLHGMLGELTEVTAARTSFALSGLEAVCMGQARVALVGEAAHVLPPIGAQGLNLGLRDAAVLAECVADARAHGEDVGGQAMLQAYHRARAMDVTARTISVDLLNRSLLSDFLPAQALRGIGLHLLANLAPLRRLAMRGGLQPAGPMPRLMRPGARP